MRVDQTEKVLAAVWIVMATVSLASTVFVCWLLYLLVHHFTQ